MELHSDPKVRAWGGPGYALAVHGGTLVQLSRVCSEQSARAARTLVRDAGAEIVATLVLFDRDITLPDEPARREMELLAKQLGTRPTAVVYEGDGFIAAAIRALHAGYARLTGQQLRPRLFTTLGDALTWLKLDAPEVAGLDQLEAYVAELRQRFGAHEMDADDELQPTSS